MTVATSKASAVVTTADGYAEREAAKVMIADGRQVAQERGQITLGADKGYDAAEFIEALTQMTVLPHAAQLAGEIDYIFRGLINRVLLKKRTDDS